MFNFEKLETWQKAIKLLQTSYMKSPALFPETRGLA